MSETDFSTTTQQKKIYTLLINYENTKFPRTQKQVSEKLGLQKSSVSDAVKRLLDLEFIAPYPNYKTNIIYRKGKNHKIIEAQISANYLEEGEWFDKNGHAVRPQTMPNRYKPMWRSHVNGHWLAFPVAVEGKIEAFDIPENAMREQDGQKYVRQGLFGSRQPSEGFKGSINYYESLLFNGSWHSIRYQRTVKGIKIFYIQPANLIQDASEMTPDEDLITPFYAQCRPILIMLEKYAGWKFKHLENKEYEVYSSGRQGRVQKEYGADEIISETLHDYAGDIGIIGESSIWYDRSPGAQGVMGEMETSKADYVEAIDKLPHTKAAVESLLVKVKALEEDNLLLKHSILEKEHFLLERQETTYSIITPPDMGITETKTTSNNGNGSKGLYQ